MTVDTSQDARDSALSEDELVQYVTNGFLRPGRCLTSHQVAQLRMALEVARQREKESDLLDSDQWPAAEGGTAVEPGRTVGFLFNLWRTDPAFHKVAFSPVLAGWAAQLVGATSVRLLEDNALFKEPGKGGTLMWHQDFPYWPLAQPNAVTAWIALDDVDIVNGAMQMAKGSHLTGEYLPAVFGSGATYYQEMRSPLITKIGDPVSLGMETEVISMKAGEVSFHHALTWHCSGPNDSDRPRRAHVIRYVGDGTIWLGERRYPYNYSDAELGLRPGSPIGGDYFPIVPGRA